MKIKNYIWLVLIIGLIGVPSAAQKRRPEPTKGARVTRPAVLSASQRAPTRTTAQSLSFSERAAALDTSISTTCAETAPQTAKPLSHDPSVFGAQRIANTLNGVWHGRVSGEYDPQLFAPDGFLNVDYYMVVDIQRGEAFVYQEFGNNRSIAAAGLDAKPGAPKWTYTWCARENYDTKSPRQIHQFTKVSDNVQDAAAVITNSVKVTFAPGEQVVLSNVWQKLVAAKFFDDPKYSLAYAGVLFKPVTLGTVQSAGGGSLFELRMVGEYRGSGETAAKFIPGEPIHNVEAAHFLGVSMTSQEFTTLRQRGKKAPSVAEAESGSGDYLSASYSLGNEMQGPKDDAVLAVFSTQMAFDKVVIGPLDFTTGAPTIASPGKVESPTKAGSRAKAGSSSGTTRAGQSQQRRAHP